MPNEVYRCFDDRGNLLYVGSSKNAWARMSMHRSRTDWASEVFAVSIERHASRWDADEAEAEAIRLESPRYNIMGNPNEIQPGSRPRKFDPTPEQDAQIRAVWLDETRSLADRCQGVIDIFGAKVPRFSLYRRYGKPGEPR